MQPAMSKMIDCPQCQGEGYVLSAGGMDFSNRYEVFEESETFVFCSHCKGEGKLEVCEACLTPLRIMNGAEVCGCEVVALPKAA